MIQNRRDPGTVSTPAGTDSSETKKRVESVSAPESSGSPGGSPMNSTDSDIPLQTNQKPADQGSIDKPSSPIPGLTELREGILKALRQDRHTLAAAMEKSEHWDIKDSVLSLTFNSPFESTFIEKENREIRDIIKEHTGWDLKIETIVKHKEESPLSEEIEEQVDLIRTVFRGTIIKRSQ